MKQRENKLTQETPAGNVLLKAAGKVSVGRDPGFVLVAYAFAVTMMGTTLPTPLYPLYQQELGFSSFLVTVIYAAYAVGVIAALLLCGQLSDEIGRRWVLLPGLLLSMASAIAFLCTGGLAPLFIGRVLSGVSAGMFTGTATAALVDLVPPDGQRRATLAATVANMGGLGLGPLLAGLLSQYAALPVGCIGLIIGLILVAGGLQARSLALLTAGAVVAGLGQGLSFRAGLTAVNAKSPSRQRGEIASSFYMVLYVALSIPVIGVGVAAQFFGLQFAGVAFSIMVAVLALLALLILLVHRGES